MRITYDQRYGPNGLETVTVLAGLRNYLKGIAEVDYAKGCDIVDAGWPATEILPAPMSEQEKQGIAEAVAKAGESDVIIAVLGEMSTVRERAVRVLRSTCRDASSNYLRHCMQRESR